MHAGGEEGARCACAVGGASGCEARRELGALVSPAWRSRGLPRGCVRVGGSAACWGLVPFVPFLAFLSHHSLIEHRLCARHVAGAGGGEEPPPSCGGRSSLESYRRGRTGALTESGGDTSFGLLCPSRAPVGASATPKSGSAPQGFRRSHRRRGARAMTVSSE